MERMKFLVRGLDGRFYLQNGIENVPAREFKALMFEIFIQFSKIK